jgi:hypothetical protein
MSEARHRPLESSSDDSQVAEALEEYLAAAEAGQPPDRRTFLARHAEIADALNECLDGLAALHVASSSSKPLAAGSHALASGAEGLPGVALGDFRIIREIGRGGMGVVYEAEQLSLGRRVALKVLPFAAALDARQLQRFKSEAQASAHLHHQNIVPVHAVGAERGVHYYAMQLIEGQNLSAVVESLRPEGAKSADEARPRTGASTPSSAPPVRSNAETQPNFGARLSTQRSGRPGEFYRTVAKERIRTSEGDWFCGPGKQRPGGPKSEPDRRSPAEKVQEVLKILTAEQAARWKEMTGEPFTGKVFRPGQPPSADRGHDRPPN